MQYGAINARHVPPMCLKMKISGDYINKIGRPRQASVYFSRDVLILQMRGVSEVWYRASFCLHLSLLTKLLSAFQQVVSLDVQCEGDPSGSIINNANVFLVSSLMRYLKRLFHLKQNKWTINRNQWCALQNCELNLTGIWWTKQRCCYYKPLEYEVFNEYVIKIYTAFSPLKCQHTDSKKSCDWLYYSVSVFSICIWIVMNEGVGMKCIQLCHRRESDD